MIELVWPWMLLALPLPALVYLLIPPAQTQATALPVPFYSRIAGQGRESSARKNPWTIVLLALAWIALADPLRPEAPAVIADAQARGLALALLTGDSGSQGPELARQLGITDFQTGMSPQEKMAEVARLQDTGAVVTMVGDGLNDAPVLARADTSIAMANAAELTRTHADLVVIDAGLESVTMAMNKARSCRRIIVQNFAWALSYNLCAIPLAATGQVAPWMAAVGMSLSSLLVVANSLRLNRPLT